MNRAVAHYVNTLLLLISASALIGFEREPLGWLLLSLSTASLIFCSKEYRKYLALLHISVGALGFAPIGTSTHFPFALYMGTGLLVALIIPYLVSTYIYKTSIVRFPSLKEPAWSTKRLLYLGFTATLCWLLLPVILRQNDIYQNWQFSSDSINLIEAYIGLNFVGIWDELFFILTSLAILYKFFPFYVANAFQAVLFTLFLFAVGFEGWAVVPVYVFALLQGYIYKNTKSLLFILAIHLTLDLFLHLTLVHLHYPNLFPFFIT